MDDFTFFLFMVKGYILEKEIKVLGISYPLLVKQLKKLWAKKVWSEYIRDRYVDHKKTPLKKTGKTIRLRSIWWKKFEITIKTKVNHTRLKVRHEHNYDMPTLEAGKLMLHMMWFECLWYKEKIRVTYKIGKTIFDIDFYDDMPPVLEIEWTNKQIYHWIRKLRLHKHKQVSRWTKKLFGHYGKKVQSMNIPVSKIVM